MLSQGTIEARAYQLEAVDEALSGSMMLVLPTAAGKKASNSILSFLELSRKLKQDGPDADLVQVAGKAAQALEEDPDAGLALEALPELIDQLEGKMKEAAKKLDFEDAANLRDRIKQLRQKMAG